MKEILRKKEMKWVLIVFLALCVSCFFCAYIVFLEKKFTLSGILPLLRIILSEYSKLFVCLLSMCGGGFALLFFYKERTIAFLYKYRFLIAGLIFVFSVCIQLHGSSLGIWETFLYGDIHDTLIGLARAIRSDEWAVTTPQVLSQYFNGSGFEYYSDLLRGITTEVFLVCGLPVMDIAIIFRPFMIGYLFLPAGFGLSFYWCGRTICLLLCSFEFGMVITNKNKRLSFVYSLLMLFAPIVQWWFSAAGLVEMLISGQLIIVLSYYFFSRKSAQWKRGISIIVFFWCAFVYLFTVYPAWQVPLGYIFLFLFIWVLYENRYTISFSKIDVLICFCSVLILGAIAIHIFQNSYDTFTAIMNTVYPGERMENGGGELSRILYYPMTLFLPLVQENLPANACELSVFIDFFPMGLILAAILAKEKKKDYLVRILIILVLFFCLRLGFKWPDFLSKVTLLSMSPGFRTHLAFSYVNLLLLIRGLSQYDKMIFSKKYAIISGILLSIIIITITRQMFWSYLTISRSMILIVVFGLVFSSMLLWPFKKGKQLFTIMMVFVTFLSGMFVNPLDSGVDKVLSLPIVQEIQEINEDSGKWIVESAFPIPNIALMGGASTINSTNNFPALEQWKKIDPQNKFVDIYNRYCHINIVLQNDNETQFSLLGTDSIKIDLNTEDLKKMDIKYILTSRDLEQFSDNNISFFERYNEDGYRIYEISY